MKPVKTIGHSNHPIERFVELLKAGGVDRLVDVRVDTPGGGVVAARGDGSEGGEGRDERGGEAHEWLLVVEAPTHSGVPHVVREKIGVGRPIVARVAH